MKNVSKRIARAVALAFTVLALPPLIFQLTKEKLNVETVRLMQVPSERIQFENRTQSLLDKFSRSTEEKIRKSVQPWKCFWKDNKRAQKSARLKSSEFKRENKQLFEDLELLLGEKNLAFDSRNYESFLKQYEAFRFISHIAEIELCDLSLQKSERLQNRLSNYFNFLLSVFEFENPILIRLVVLGQLKSLYDFAKTEGLKLNGAESSKSRFSDLDVDKLIKQSDEMRLRMFLSDEIYLTPGTKSQIESFLEEPVSLFIDKNRVRNLLVRKFNSGDLNVEAGRKNLELCNLISEGPTMSRYYVMESLVFDRMSEQQKLLREKLLSLKNAISE